MNLKERSRYRSRSDASKDNLSLYNPDPDLLHARRSTRASAASRTTCRCTARTTLCASHWSWTRCTPRWAEGGSGAAGSGGAAPGSSKAVDRSWRGDLSPLSRGSPASPSGSASFPSLSVSPSPHQIMHQLGSLPEPRKTIVATLLAASSAYIRACRVTAGTALQVSCLECGV